MKSVRAKQIRVSKNSQNKIDYEMESSLSKMKQRLNSERKKRTKELAACLKNGEFPDTLQAKRLKKDNDKLEDKYVEVMITICNNETTELWEEYVNDKTLYELSDQSNDSDSNSGDDYDSTYFNMIEFGSNKGKRLMTFKGKYISKWAENKDKINKLLIYQKENINPDIIFGKLNVETINLHMVFGSHYKRDEVRGSSANWKNENWTSIISNKPARGISREEEDPVENLDGKFILSQTYDKLEEVLSKDAEAASNSGDDILGLNLVPSWDENN